MTSVLIGAISLLTLASLLLSMARISLQLLSPIAVRRLAEKSAGRSAEHFLAYLTSPLRIQLPLQITNQSALVTIAVLSTALVFREGLPWPLLLSLAVPWTVLILFNHILPRVIAHSSPERVASALLPTTVFLSSLLGPVGHLVAWLVVGRGSEVSSRDEDERREELTALIDVGKDAGILGKEDASLVGRLVDFGDTILREVMTPRVDMVCVKAEIPLPELVDTFLKEGFARIPVYRERLDNIEGFVHVKDVLAALRAGSSELTARELAKPISFEPETKRVAQTLRDLQAAKRQMAICIDEYGSVSGLVTIEDLLEEIVGEIHDEYDEEAPLLARDDKGHLLLSGKAPIETLQEELGIEVKEDDFETVSGLVLSLLGRIPQKGEHVDYEGFRFEVTEADRRRIQKLRVLALEAPKAATTKS